VSAVVGALSVAGVLCAASLVPAPTGVVFVTTVVCVAYSMAAGHELCRAVAVLRTFRRARAELRRELDALPQTRHPLDA
jgi:hypothetical protein